jgi:hypothetical protein
LANRRIDNRKTGKEETFTSWPYKHELVAAEERKKANKIRKRLPFSKQAATKCGRKGKTRRRVSKYFKDDREEAEYDDDALCQHCEDWHSTPTEAWTTCPKCHKQAHNSCPGANSDDSDAVHVCPQCVSRVLQTYIQAFLLLVSN